MYKVIIVDDEKYVRKSIRAKIDWSALNCEIVAEADNGLSALELLENTYADIMLIDIKMPKLDGLELIEQIRRKSPELQIAIISGHDNFSYTKQAMRLQVSDFIKKPINASDLEQAVSIMVGRIEALQKKI